MTKTSLKFAAAILTPLALAGCASTSGSAPQTGFSENEDVVYGEPGYDEQGDAVYPKFPASSAPAAQPAIPQYAVPTRPMPQYGASDRFYDPSADRRNPAFASTRLSRQFARGACPLEPSVLRWRYNNMVGMQSKPGCYWTRRYAVLDGDGQWRIQRRTEREILGQNEMSCNAQGAALAGIADAKFALQEKMMNSSGTTPCMTQRYSY